MRYQVGCDEMVRDDTSSFSVACRGALLAGCDAMRCDAIHPSIQTSDDGLDFLCTFSPFLFLSVPFFSFGF